MPFMSVSLLSLSLYSSHVEEKMTAKGFMILLATHTTAGERPPVPVFPGPQIPVNGALGQLGHPVMAAPTAVEPWENKEMREYLRDFPERKCCVDNP